MEKRKIIVVSSATQSQVAFESDAVTLGELKKELDSRNVSYDGMTFLEGHSKVQLDLDDAILPTNIPYKGDVTNDLVFLLTTPQKKIKSGYDRCTIYGIIRDKNLTKKIEEKFHKNFTNVSTPDLIEFLESLCASNDEEEEEGGDTTYNPERTSCTCGPCGDEKVSFEDSDTDPVDDLINGIKAVINGMVKLGYIENASMVLPDEHQLVSDKELKDMFGNLV